MPIEITRERYAVQVLGRMFQYVGEMEPIGQAVDYFNDENRTTFPMYDADVYPIDAGSRLTSFKRPALTINNSEMGAIYFLDPEYRKKVQLLRNFDQIIAYTPRAVLRGKFHRGVETRLNDLFDMMGGDFLAMSDVSVFPLVDLPGAFPKQAELLIVNRFYVSAYHKE